MYISVILVCSFALSDMIEASGGNSEDSMFRQLVCQQCSLLSSTEQRIVEARRIGKAGPRGPVGPRGLPGIVNMTAIEGMVDRKIDEALGFLSTRSCRNVKLDSAKSLNETGGVYDIFVPSNLGLVEVYCDIKTDGGNWLVFQRRMDGSTDFYRKWNDYQYGFGHVDKEFWLGLEAIHQLTKNDDHELRIDMIKIDGTHYYAKYRSFKVGQASDNYRLSVSGYSGNATDSLAYHNGHQFTTKDADNDSFGRNCAIDHKGAWWYAACDSSNLNALHDQHNSWSGVYWYDQAQRERIHMQYTEMKLKKKN